MARGEGKPLLPVDEAIAIVERAALELVAAVPRASRVASLSDAVAARAVIARDVVADRPFPPFDKAMMDGFALRTADLTGDDSELAIVGEIAAGAVAGSIGPGEAKAIMTGAPVPDGADAVQLVERCERLAGRVRVHGRVEPGANITRIGSHARVGAVVVERGRVVDPLTAGVLASVGASRVEIYEPPRVTVIATGDELVPIDAVPGPTQIRDSNRTTLMALAAAEGCYVEGGLVPDDPALMRAAIRAGLASDVLVLSGGVSAGAYDFVRGCLESEGVAIRFRQIAIKPGKPALFGTTARGLVLGLPGNPVSTYVTALLLLCPALRALALRPRRALSLRLPLAEGALEETGRRATFHPGDLVQAADGLAVRPRAWDGSADHIAYARGGVMIRCEPGDPARAAGDLVTVVLVDGLR